MGSDEGNGGAVGMGFARNSRGDTGDDGSSADTFQTHHAKPQSLDLMAKTGVNR
jgi:hypothetical protein